MQVATSGTTAPPGLGLSPFQLDALAETFNLSLGEAAAAFSQLVAEEIELSVPVVELLTREQLFLRTAVTESERMCGIRQQFDAPGSFHTETMLVFPEHGSLEIVRRMLGAVSSIDEITEIEQDALAEIGNIVINSCMNSIANLFKTELCGTLPTVTVTGARQLFMEHCATHQVLVARIGMHMAAQNLKGYVLFMMDISSIRSFIVEVERAFAV